MVVPKFNRKIIKCWDTDTKDKGQKKNEGIIKKKTRSDTMIKESRKWDGQKETITPLN